MNAALTITAESQANLVFLGDCLDWLRTTESKSVDLVFGSPPYEAARTYGMDFKLKGQAWVDWMVERMAEMVRVSRGLVAMVLEGQTRQYRWSATPALLMADLHRRGIHLRKPPIFHRIGIPGSGGHRGQHSENGGSVDWLRNDYEFIICCTEGPGKLPWADALAMGHPPRWAPGGEMSNRLTSGARVNQWGHPINSGATVVDDGGVVRSKGKRPSHVVVDGRDQWGGTPTATSGEGRKTNGQSKGKMAAIIDADGAEPKVADALLNGMKPGAKLHTKSDGESMRVQCYTPPAVANPGNVIQQLYTTDEVAELLEQASNVTHHLVGGGLMGSKKSHENEAPFPESLAEFFVRSFCPEGGIVLDPFCGSGTTLAVAERWGRRWIGLDVRQSQVDLSRRRVAEVRKPLFTA